MFLFVKIINNSKIMSFKKTKTAIIGGLISLILAGSLAISPAFAADDVASQIAVLMAQIQMLQAQLEVEQSTPVVISSFVSNLSLGSKGEDVKKLQQVLNRDVDTIVSITGAGSKGMETLTFGPATKAAVIKFQTKYGISPAAGFVGAITRAKLNSLVTPVVVSPEIPTVLVTPSIQSTSSSLTIKASTVQPANILAPSNATRIPFTKFVLTAGATDVTLSSVVVERTGMSLNSSLESVVLMDESGTQIGIAKTLNSLNRAVVGDPIVIKAGTSRTFTIGANRPDNADNGGTTVSLDVVAINSSASVFGGEPFPIRGATHTINANLQIGTVKVLRGGIDPGADQGKELGTVGYTFSSIKVTAGSAEALTLKSIKWNQVESAGLDDLANLKTYVDGVSFDAVSTDGGRTFLSSFGNGISISKGFSKDISIKGDIIGGSSRKIRFDIAKRTDLNLIGNVYGYGVLPPLGTYTGTASQFQTTEDPWFRGSTVTMSNGTMTISSDNLVPSQNVAINLDEQALGGWVVEVRGEPISVDKMVFSNSTVSKDITNLVLVDDKGSVLAGPVDATAGFVTFTDSVTFPAGITKFVLKGKIGTSFATNDTLVLSTNPGTQWTTVRGQITGNTITLPSSVLTASTMTVKAGALSISASSQPVSQNVIAGSKQFEFARIVLDAGQSGENVRITSIPLKLTYSGITASNLSSCQLYDGLIPVTTGGNVKNPSVSSGSEETFVFDGTGLVVPKGTSKTLSVKCNVASNITGSIYIGLKGTDISSASGMDSGQTISETTTASNGQIMTLASSGGFVVNTDSSSLYNYRAVKAGTEVAFTALRFSASVNEDITLRQIALQLGNVASNSPADLLGQQVTLWDGSTQVGVAQFTTSDYATSTLTTSVVIPKGGVKTIIVKGTLAVQDAVNGTPGAFFSVNYDGDNNGLNGNYGTGFSSGVIVPGTSSDTSTAGVRIFSNIPTVQVLSNGGTFQNNVDTFKFTVSNPGDRDLAFGQVTFSVATTGGSASDFTLFADGVAVSGASNPVNGILKIKFDSNSNGKIIPAGSSKTFTLKCANLVDTSMVSETLSVALKADAVYPSLSGLMGTFAEVAGSNIVWSPMSTTTLQANDASLENLNDWTNGFGLPGFPAVGSDFGVQVWIRSN